MITTLPADDLILIGARYRGADLVHQAAYTLHLARAEAGLDQYLPEGVFEEVETSTERVEKALRDPALVEREKKDSSLGVGVVIRAVKVWRRRLLRITEGAAMAHPQIPQVLRKAGRIGSDASHLARSLISRLEQLKELRSALAPFGLRPEFVQEGERLLKELLVFKPQDESQRLKALPDGLREFYRDKGALYLGLKLITTAGQAQHADDLEKAARFNLNTLYRAMRTASDTHPPRKV
jgi:hypothetical protein